MGMFCIEGYWIVVSVRKHIADRAPRHDTSGPYRVAQGASPDFSTTTRNASEWIARF
jgi:hypothetical protein